MIKRAALYLRQSKSDDTGQGPDRQLDRTRKLAEARGWQVVDTYLDDGVSASKARGAGTQWARMLADADAGLLDVVIGVDLDRLLRSTRDLNTLIDHGLQVVTVDGEIDLSTADGEFRATMLAGIARFEVRRKGERQTRANAQRAARGGVPKGVRLTGYTTAGEIFKDEAAVVRALFEGFAAGDTLRGLSRDHSLTPSTVRTILMNPRYVGRRVYRGVVQVVPGAWKPIVSEALFDTVARRLADPDRKSNRTGSTARKWLGSSLFLCECGSRMRSTGTTGDRRYMCPACGQSRTAGPIDDYALRLVRGRLAQLDAREALSPDVDADPLRAEHAMLTERRAGLAGLVIDGTLLADDVRREVPRLDARIAELSRQLDALTSPALAVLTPEQMAGDLASLSLDRLRAVVDALLTLTLSRVPRGRRGFDPNTVEVTWK